MGWRGDRLGRGGYRGNRRDAVAKLDSQPPLLQPLLEHARNIEAETISENYARVRFRIDTGDQLAILGLVLSGKLLKLSGRLVEPRRIESSHHLCNDGTVRR